MIDREILDRMAREWDERARSNALHYIATGEDSWDEEEFYRSGGGSR